MVRSDCGVGSVVGGAMRFVVPGQPVGKQRPRFARGRAYTPKKTADYEKHVAAYARLALAAHGPIPDGPVAVRLVLVFDRPKRLLRKKDPPGRMWHTMTPDIDNCAKACLDGLQGVLFKDDRCVVSLIVEAFYRAKDEKPGVCFEVRAAPDWVPHD